MEPFEINFHDEVFEDLRRRLSETRWPNQIGSSWEYGTDLTYLKELCEYWRTKFDWRAQEKTLNRFDHFMTEIDSLNVHFIHQRSENPNALPIVITHGWPGSIFEFVKIIGPLSDPTTYGGDIEDAFHVVCISMPGFGFSDPPDKPGFDIKQVAKVVAKLMARLDYPKYGAQGGDWGSSVSSWLGSLDEEHVCGIHLNLVAVSPPKGLRTPFDGLSQKEIAYLKRRQNFMKYEVGYREVQSTKPLTLSYSLNDSPAGLAGWIVEKFRSWSDCAGHIERRFTKDELLTNITIYWATQTIDSSMRVYYETRKSKNFYPQNVNVPTGCAIFPEEILNVPREWAEKIYNVKRWTEMRFGGHFAALEAPGLLVEDIRAFFRQLR
jgi:pimeloyl-ACP methyl ester carboxylesterase